MVAMKIRSAFLALVLALGLVQAVSAQEVVARTFDAMQPESGLQMTKVRLLTDNPDSWYARWYLLENAQESIDVTYFIVENDIFGQSLLGLLYKRAQEGLKVRVLVDARGTKALSRKIFSQSFLQALAKLPNCQVRVFNPYHRNLLKIPENIRNAIASNHDKILLVDRQWAITGGRNISQNYFADPADLPSCYRDTDVLLQGEGIGRQMELAFEEEFEAMANFEVHEGWFSGWGDKAFELEVARRVMQRWINGRGTWDAEEVEHRKLFRRLNEEVTAHSKLTAYAAFQGDPWQGRRAYPTKVLDKHSFKGVRNDITPNMVAMMESARDYILIQNPYVVVTQEIMAALKRASDRGVRIILHTNSPASTDSLITQAFFLRDWWKLLRDLPTLRIFVFEKQRKLHAKAFVIDDMVASIGTYNLDPMSQGINSEVMAVIKEPTFATRCRMRIETDLAESVEYTIRIDETGVVHPVSGPDQHLAGFKGTMIQLLSKLGFLRPII